MLKGIRMLFEAGLIFPLISTTSNGKVLQPKMLCREMAVHPRGKTNSAIKLTIQIFVSEIKIKLWINMPGDLFFLLCGFLLSKFDDWLLKYSFIVFSEARQVVPAVGIATLHPCHQYLWQMWYHLRSYLYHTTFTSRWLTQKHFPLTMKRNVHLKAPPTPSCPLSITHCQKKNT